MPPDYALTDHGINMLGRGISLPSWATDFSSWKGQRVLDVGAGGGALVRELRSQDVDAFGFDIVSKTFKESRGRGPNDHFFVATATALPLAADSFFAATSAWSVFYYWDRGTGPTLTRQAIEELARVVQPGGELRLFGVDPKAYRVIESIPSVAMRHREGAVRGVYPALSLTVA